MINYRRARRVRDRFLSATEDTDDDDDDDVASGTRCDLALYLSFGSLSFLFLSVSPLLLLPTAIYKSCQLVEQAESRQPVKSEFQKEVRSNPSAHLRVIKTYNSWQPSSARASSLIPFALPIHPPRHPLLAGSASSRGVSSLHLPEVARVPRDLLHISYFVPQLLYRASVDFGRGLERQRGRGTRRGRGGRGANTYLPVGAATRIHSK